MALENLTENDALRRAEYTRRRKFYDEKTINSKLREEQEKGGWVYVADLKSGAIKLKKAKSHDEVLENRIWCILYQLGYPVLNVGRKFSIEIANHDGKIVTKQVDVFAKDDETVIVVECKSCEEMQTRDLRKDISEFAALRKPVSNEIRRHFGKEYKPKILWVFATWNDSARRSHAQARRADWRDHH
jgi:hypothetical protein